MLVFGMKFEGWRKAVRKSGRWFQGVKKAAELFMRNRHETERRKTADRRAKAGAASSTVGISKLPGGGGRGRRRRKGIMGGGDGGKGGRGASCPRGCGLGLAIIV